MGCECLVEITTLVVTIVGFLFSIKTLIKGRNDIRISNVIELKKILTDFTEINHNLFPSGKWNEFDFDFNSISIKDFSDFNSYAGTFEIAKLMLENDSLSEKEFEIFFLYRLSNIATCKAAMSNIMENRSNWKNLLELMKQFELINE